MQGTKTIDAPNDPEMDEFKVLINLYIVNNQVFNKNS